MGLMLTPGSLLTTDILINHCEEHGLGMPLPIFEGCHNTGTENLKINQPSTASLSQNLQEILITDCMFIIFQFECTLNTAYYST